MKKNYFEKYLKHIEPRISILTKNKLYIEAFLLLCTVLEEEIKFTIEMFEDKYKTIKFKNFSSDYLYNSTLGKTSKYLYIFDDSLKSEIEYFIKLRNKCVHKIFEEDFTKIDLKLNKSINRLYKLLYKLSEINVINLGKMI